MKQAEFDQYADAYHDQHAANIALSGEDPDFFAEYKIADLLRLTTGQQPAVARILDFGSGIGNSIPHFRRYFPASALFCADASPRSLEIAAQRFPGPERQIVVTEGARLDVPDGHFDLCFSACVFHHIAHEQHRFWLDELHRVTRPGGLLVIFEHNPWNPLTVRAVRTCPFDANARLVTARRLAATMRSAGWDRPRCAYRIFFPAPLARLRPLERQLEWLPLGAQYRLAAHPAPRR